MTRLETPNERHHGVDGLWPSARGILSLSGNDSQYSLSGRFDLSGGGASSAPVHHGDDAGTGADESARDAEADASPIDALDGRRKLPGVRSADASELITPSSAATMEKFMHSPAAELLFGLAAELVDNLGKNVLIDGDEVPSTGDERGRVLDGNVAVAAGDDD